MKIATRVAHDTRVLSVGLVSVGKKLIGNGRGRWLAILASLIVSAGMLYAQGTERHAEATKAPCCAPTPAASPTSAEPAPANPPNVASAAEAEALAALASTAPTTAQSFQFPLPRGVAPEGGLQIKTIWAARIISVLFPQITTIGGYRPDALPWHPNGLAIDVMIPNYHTPEGIELGNQIAGYALANSKRWGINHVIWRQKIYLGTTGGSWTADMGNETANHYDHVHIATDGGGYPTGHETYFIATISR